mgnify:CR=1 FL=1
MKALLDIEEKKIQVDFSKGQDISIPLLFNGDQPNTYNVGKAISKPYSDGQFIGDTRKGGPCNFETYSITPHCNGTHTECVGHITKERISILSSLKEEIILSILITVCPETSKENYNPPLNSEDLVITKKQLEDKLKDINFNCLDALIIRTLPNTKHKKERDYMETPSAFFTIEAMNYIVSLGIKHLLVDTPSVDRLFDDGILSAHNIFWETKEKLFNINTACKTITEMIFVPNKIKDGKYLLNLQVAPFFTDAAPSRPILYKINEL